MWRLVCDSDHHVTEPKDLYDRHLTASFKQKYWDKLPKVERYQDGGDGWSFGGRQARASEGNSTAAGKNMSEYKDWGWTFEDMRPGQYDPMERLKDMDIDGIYSAMLFGGRGKGASLELDGYEYYMAITQAWNNHVLEDWQEASGGERLIALPVMPPTGIDDAVAELKRVAEKGAKGVAFGSVFPNGTDRVKWEDDRFWAALQEYDIPVAVHLGFGMESDNKKYVPDEDGRWSARMAVMQFQRTGGKMATVIANLIYHGVFERFPGIKFLSVETGCGWLPFYAEQLDDNFQRHRFWGQMDLKERPSEYLKRNVLATFQYDLAAMKFREGFVDNFMWSSDYPHTGCDWPNSQKVIEFHTHNIPDEEKWKMLGGNYARVFKLKGPATVQNGAKAPGQLAPESAGVR